MSEALAGRRRGSRKAALFTESVIREMTRLSMQYGGVNLAQGFPDFPAPAEVKEAAVEAIRRDINQYAITWGAKSLRDALAGRYRSLYGMDVDPERHFTVACGSTEAMIATMLAVVDPGDEVIVFEPFYENYGPDTVLSGAVPRYVRLQEPDWSIDEDALREAVTDRTRAIIVNTPQNPSGKVFSERELSRIASLCIEHDLIAFTDEIYEFITYENARHIPIATLPGMADRTVTISGLSKSYSVTGWRVGWTVASEELSSAIRKVHDFLTVGAAAPLQEAGAAALKLPESYYEDLRNGYQERRDLLISGLAEVGFRCFEPDGAYYVMTDISDFGFPDDVAFAEHLVKTVGVAAVPGSSFYADPAAGRQRLRFTFCKNRETLVEAVERLRRLR